MPDIYIFTRENTTVDCKRHLHVDWYWVAVDFVFYNFRGGWDSLLSWDPRDPAVFTQATMGETGIYPAYERLVTTPSHGIFVDSALGKLGGFVGDLRLKKYTVP